jgi:2-polyprenyl-6-methoxyphenol hydroxylase-like FAD-dependent oxidoreductase
MNTNTAVDDGAETVVIAGAGPNGLMLACELALAGMRPVVLERKPAAQPEQRANGLVGQVVRMLDRRGLFEALSGWAGPPEPTGQFVFGALPLYLGDVPDNPLYTLPVPQHRIEEVLAERATALGVRIRHGHEVAGLRQDDGAVTLDVRTGTGGYAMACRFLVGADGGRSTVRKLAGIEFPGVTDDDSLSRQASVSVPAAYVDGATGGLNVPGYGVIPPFLHHRTERGLLAWAPFPGRPAMLVVVERAPGETDPGTPLTIEELRAALRRVLGGADVPLEPPTGDGPLVARRVVGGNTRIAERYRAGRVLLVGDAAHVHSAIGGPGLNLGLQDAVNLGWKLAAVARGGRPAGAEAGGLLDTYEAERRPVAQRVTMHTAAQSALIAPGPQVTALRELFAELLDDPANRRRIAALMAGDDVCYDGLREGTDPHPLTGRWAPDLPPAAGVRLAELTRDARPLLVDVTGTLRAPDGVTLVRVPAGPPGVSAMLLRPDCYVAWAAAGERPGQAAIDAAARRWV